MKNLSVAKNGIVVLNFYQFHEIRDKNLLLYRTLFIAKRKSIKGTILIADEGFNASISGLLEDVNSLLNEFIIYTKNKQVNLIYSYVDTNPFDRLRVKLKNEIVSLKAGILDVVNKKGKYIYPENWDQFIELENVLVIDVRNSYEYELGHFRKSINPNVNTFVEMKNWVTKNQDLFKSKQIATYCTGGIRCEKFSAYINERFKKNNIYQLKGGILGYLQEKPILHKKSCSPWKGKCFVFDKRISV